MKTIKLSREQTEKIARLANLQLTDAEISLYSNQLSETLEYVEILDTLNTKAIKQTLQGTGLSNVTRADEVKPSLSQDEALSATKNKYNGYFKVAAIFEEK